MRGAAAALALGLLVLAPGAASAQEAPPTPSTRSTDETPVTVLVTTLKPKAPVAGRRLEVSGTLTNDGAETVQDLRVALKVGDKLITRSQLAVTDEDGAATRRVSGSVVADTVPLAPGATRRFTVSTEVDALGLDGDGAYPLEVEVRGLLPGGSRSDQVGLAATFLPWFRTPPTGTTRLAFVLPLTSAPVQAPRRTDAGSTLLDDTLAASLAPDGALSDALRGARGAQARPVCDQQADGDPAPVTCRAEPVPVTYAVDADLLETVQGMADGYRVRLSEDELGPGAGSAAARAWLEQLRAGVEGAPVLALPFADPDVVALSDPDSGLVPDVGTAVQLGRTALPTWARALDGVTLAPAGPLTSDALDAYAGARTRALLVGEDVLPPRPDAQTSTSGARDALPAATGQLTALVADDGLSRLLAPETTGPGWQGARLAEQRFLVETAMISAEDPYATKTLLVVPPKGADLVPAVVAQSVQDAGRLPWLCGVPLEDAVAGTEQCPLGGPVGQPAAERGAPVLLPDPPALSEAQVEAVREARARVDQLTVSVLARGEAAAATRGRLLRAGLRAESSAWRDPDLRSRGRTLAELLQDDVDDLLGRVTLLTGPVTLTSSRGTLSVSVSNQLGQPVTVRVGVEADNAARLAVQDTAVQTVPARNSVPVTLEAEPRTSGSFPVRARLYDRNGDPFGTEQTFVIRSTRYGTVALAVTGVAAGVLLVAAGVRLVKRGLGR